MMLYLAFKKILGISFNVHQCDRFTHKTKESHDADVKRICQHLQGTNGKGLVFNPSNKMLVDCYIDEYFSRLWRNENNQEPICDSSTTEFVVTFVNCPLLWHQRYRKRIFLYDTL